MKNLLKSIACIIALSILGPAFSVTDQTVINYAPIVNLHVNEKFFPSSVEFFLEYVHEQNGHLVTNQALHHPSDDSLQFFQGQSTTTQPPVYAITVPKPNIGANIYDVHYFFFYPYNRGKNVCVGRFVKAGGVGCIGGYSTFGNHVGDWENIRIRFSDETPISLNLSVHDFNNEYPLTDSSNRLGEFEHENTHIIVYSAQGSHGTYLKPGRFVYKKLPNDELVDYTSNGGRVWRTYENTVIIPYHPVGQYPEQFAFMNFSGRWGNSKDTSKCAFGQCVLEAGPVGPSMKGSVNPYAP